MTERTEEKRGRGRPCAGLTAKKAVAVYLDARQLALLEMVAKKLGTNKSGAVAHLLAQFDPSSGAKAANRLDALKPVEDAEKAAALRKAAEKRRDVRRTQVQKGAPAYVCDVPGRWNASKKPTPNAVQVRGSLWAVSAREIRILAAFSDVKYRVFSDYTLIDQYTDADFGSENVRAVVAGPYGSGNVTDADRRAVRALAEKRLAEVLKDDPDFFSRLGIK